MRTLTPAARCGMGRHRLRFAKEPTMSCRCGTVTRPMTSFEILQTRTMEMAFQNALKPSLLIQLADRSQAWTA